MPTLDQIADRLERGLIAADARRDYRVLTGRRISDTQVTLDGAQEGKVWVRGFDQSREETQVWGYASLANATVFVRKDRRYGDYLTGRIDWQLSVANLGAAAAAALLVRGGDETAPHSIVGMGLRIGRFEPSALGGMFVHVAGFHYDGGFWRGGAADVTALGGLDQTVGDEDLTAYIPAGTGEVGWVRAYLDPSTGTLGFAAGTPVVGDVSVLDEADIETIAIPTGAIPLGAIALYNGQTEITSADRFADARYWLNSSPSGVALLQTIMMSADGFAMVDADGFMMLGS